MVGRFVTQGVSMIGVRETTKDVYNEEVHV